MADPRMKVTGERLVPGDVKSAVDYLHLLRHQFAYDFVRSQLQKTDKVLDVGFGEGYGTAMLAQVCAIITGVDVANNAVAYANDTYKSDNCWFDLYDGRRLPYDDNTFDTVVSFQVIEHVLDDLNFVSEIHRVLKKGGRLFLTTPNKTTRLKPGQKPWNRYHMREYYPKELREVFCRFFDDVKILGVTGTDEINQIEFNRVKQGAMLTSMLKLGLRKLMPASVDAMIARSFGRFRQRKYADKYGDDFLSRYSVNDYRIETAMVDQSLDLLGVAVK